MATVDLNDLADVTAEQITTQSETITTIVPAGKTLKLETTPDGEEVASGVVPDGKEWEVQWIMCIRERVPE